MINVFFAAALVLFSSSAISNEEARALKPIVTKGDTWTYRTVTSLGVNRKVALETVTVTFVDEAADSIHASVDRRPEGTMENPDPDVSGLWTSDWNSKIISRRGMEGMGAVIRPHGGFFKFPLKMGDAYESKFELTTGTKGGGGYVYNVRRKTRVTRWEEITVSAGTFKAIVIESEAAFEQVSSGKTFLLNVRFWYSPEVRREVKSISKGWPEDVETELLSYKLMDLR